MNGLPYFPLYAQDFLMGTMGMNDAEVAAYIRLLCLQWDKGEIHEDDIKKAVSMSLGRNKTATIMSVLNNKFDIVNGAWINKRLAEERDKATNLHAKKRAAGKKGGESKRDKNLAQLKHSSSTAKAELKHTSSIQSQSQNQNQSQSITTNSTSKKTQLCAPPNGSNALTNEKEPTNNKQKKKAYSDEFEAWWKTYLRSEAKSAAAKSFGKLNAAERIQLAKATENYRRHLEAQNGEISPVYGSTFINGRYLDYDDETTEKLIAEATEQKTPYQAGNRRIRQIEQQARDQADIVEGQIVEGQIVESQTPLLGEPTAEDIANHERMQNSDIYQMFSKNKNY